MDKLLYFPSIDELGQRTSDVLFDHGEEFEKTAGAYDYPEAVSSFLKSVTPDTAKSLYMLLHALGAGEAWGQNSNGDVFEEWALKHDGPEYGHKTFETNAKLYKHHINKDPEKSYGNVLFSHYDDRMKRVLLVVAIDRNRAPDICDRIENYGEYPDVSMGCKVPYDICIICGNKAKSPEYYCNHARYEMGKIYPDGRRVGVLNPFPRFFDISQVFIGAEKPAKFLHKIASADMGLVGDSQSMFYNMGVKDLSQPSAFLAEKVGYVLKSADMIKEIPAGETGVEPQDDKHHLVMCGLSKLREREKRIPAKILEIISQYPVKTALATLTSQGIALRPEEFQRMVLVRSGQSKLAQVLEDKNIQFKITDDLLDIEPMFFDKSDIDPELEKLSAPLMPFRSDLQPHLMNRTMGAVNDKEKNFDKYYLPTRTNVAPGIAGIAGLYLAYKKGLLSALGPVNDSIEELIKMLGLQDVRNPAVIIPIAAGAAAVMQGAQGLLREHGRPEAIANSDMLKLSGVSDLALLTGAFAAPYVAREHVIQKAQRGEDPGLTGRMLYKYPGVAATASLLAAPGIINKGKQLKSFIDSKAPEIIEKGKQLKNFVNSKFLGKMFKRASSNVNTIDSWFENEDCNKEWKYLYDNFINNDFWSEEKIAHMTKKAMNTVTVLGLATLGSLEE